MCSDIGEAMYLGANTQGRLDEAVRDVAAALAPVVGEDFFQSLVLLLGDVLGVDHVFVAELDCIDHDRVHMLAMASRGQLVDGHEFPLGASASALALDQGTLTVAARAAREFPDDELLSVLGVEGFCGRRLADTSGLSIGLVAALHGSTLPETSFTESLMATFSTRVAAELERRRTEVVLHDNELRLRSLVDSAPVCIQEIDRSGRFLSANAEGARLTGSDCGDEMIGRAYLDHVASWDRNRVGDFLARAFEGRVCQFEYTSVVDGQARIIGANLIPLRGHDERVEKLLGYAQDITTRKNNEQRLVHRAEHDSLTDLPNRGLFLDRLRSAIARAKRSDRAIALLYVDLNNFKPVNDDNGHQIGDRLLRVVAQRLVSTVREVDTVARIGGDEFAIILEAISDVEDAAAVAGKIAETMAEPFSIEGRTLRIGASTGIAIYPGDGDDVSALLQHADAEMYRAKRSSPEFRAP